MDIQGRRPGGLWPALVALAGLAAALAALIVQAEGPAQLVGQARTALWWLGGAIAAGALAAVAWWLERRRAQRLIDQARAEEATRASGRIAELEGAVADRDREIADGRRELAEQRERFERELAEQRERLEREHTEQRERLEGEIAEQRDRSQRFTKREQAERAANRQLRQEIAEVQHHQGTLGEWGDIRDLVLRTALALTDAGKGLLLTRDGESLKVGAHEGFEGDPSDSSLAERFGHEVIEHDQIIREDEPEDTPEGDDSHADREIENLVAIPIYVRDEFNGVVVCANREGGFEELGDDVLLALGDQAGAALHNTRLHDELRRSYVSTIRVLAEAIQAKDPFLRGHSEEVSDYVAAVGKALGMDPEHREQLAIGSLLHDLGKIGISERILHKPARLTQEEFAIIQLHPRIGYRLIEQVPSLQPVAPAILHHHERFDGGGYPSGLKGEQIPLEARIVCVADAFSAMTADRPYRARMPLAAACEELERHAGTQFDPEIVRVFVEEVRKRPEAGDDLVAAALDDAELQAHRTGDEPVLGAGAIALTDSLTLLYSHRYFHEAAAAEAERARIQDRAFSIVLVHTDEVEHVNATDGYAAGDAHLRMCARTVSRLAVHWGATACREGGLTLGMLVPPSSSDAPEELEAQARAELRDCGAVRVSVETWRPGDTGDAVIARARAGLIAAGEPTL